MASSRGKAIRGAGGLFKRNTHTKVESGVPHGGEEGEIRINMVNHKPRLYAKVGNEWWNTPLFKNPLSIFEENASASVNLLLDGNSDLKLTNNRIHFNGGVGKHLGRSYRDSSIAIGDKTTMGSIVPSVLAANNIAIGKQALELATECQLNIAIGPGAMQYIGGHADDGYTDCYSNVAIGFAALQGKSGGRPQAKENTAVGHLAMNDADTISDAANITCLFNTALGAYAGGALEGQYNTCVGSGAGRYAPQTGNNNTILGSGAAASAVGAENQTILGYGVTGIADNSAVIGNASVTAVYMAQDQGAAVWLERINMLERSSDPTEPTEGHAVIWMSDGTGKGADGDVIIASKAGGTTNYGTLFDHSGGSSW